MGYNWASALAVALLVCAAPAHADSISIVASGTIPSGCTVGKTSDFGTAILTASGTVTAGALVDCNTPFLIRSTSAKGAIKNTAAASAVLSPSMIETFVNGRSVERRSFQPGNYTLQDFPVAEGSNTVKLQIEDASGKLRTVDFSVYANQSLLAPATMDQANWHMTGIGEVWTGCGRVDTQHIDIVFYRKGNVGQRQRHAAEGKL